MPNLKFVGSVRQQDLALVEAMNMHEVGYNVMSGNRLYRMKL